MNLKKVVKDLLKKFNPMAISTSDAPEVWAEFLGGWNNVAGMQVTSETAMRSSSVYSAVRLIAGALASCPLIIYRKTKKGEKIVKDHYLNKILQQEPWSRMTAATMFETVVWHMLLKGNGYILIHRNNNGRVLFLELLRENAVSVERIEGRLRYGVVSDKNVYRVYDQDDILHLPSPFWRGEKAVSFIHWTAMSVGLNLAALDNAASFYENGARVGGTIEFDKKMTPEAVTILRKHYREVQAGRENQHTPLIISGGGKFNPTTMTAKDQMIVEQLRFNVTDISRLFNIPPLMLGEHDKSSSQPGSLENLSRNFVTYCLGPHLQRFEQEFSRKLFKTPDYLCRFSVEGLLRGDHKTRSEYNRKSLGSLTEPGWMTQNEVRERENLPPIVGGDKLLNPSETKGDESEKNYSKSV